MFVIFKNVHELEDGAVSTLEDGVTPALEDGVTPALEDVAAARAREPETTPSTGEME